MMSDNYGKTESLRGGKGDEKEWRNKEAYVKEAGDAALVP